MSSLLVGFAAGQNTAPSTSGPTSVQDDVENAFVNSELGSQPTTADLTKPVTTHLTIDTVPHPSSSILFKELFHTANFGLHIMTVVLKPLDYGVGFGVGTLSALYLYITAQPESEIKIWDDKLSGEFSKSKSLLDKAFYLGSQLGTIHLLRHNPFHFLESALWATQTLFAGYKGYSMGQDLTQRTIVWLNGSNKI